jgi:hypothetical protein
VPRKILNYLRQNILALLALFVALAGTSYAAISLPRNSVGTKQIRKHAVTSSKLAKHSVAASNLDPKSIAGHVADWAQIRANGEVISSSPKAAVSIPNPGQGLIRVSWHRSIPASCAAFANPANVPFFLGPVTANVSGPENPGPSADLVVQTFDRSGNNVPENVNVVVICP